MLRDRLVLVEKENQNLNEQSKQLYKEIVILGESHRKMEYAYLLDELSTMKEEKKQIKIMLAQGKE